MNTNNEVLQELHNYFAEFAPHELLTSSGQIINMTSDIISTICEGTGLEPSQLGAPLVISVKLLHLNENSTPQFIDHLIFPDVSFILEIRSVYYTNSWCYYPRIVPEEEWTSEHVHLVNSQSTDC